MRRIDNLDIETIRDTLNDLIEEFNDMKEERDELKEKLANIFSTETKSWW